MMNLKSFSALGGIVATVAVGYQTTKILPNRVAGGSSGNVMTSDGTAGQWSSSLPASLIGSGQLSLARGGTGQDFSGVATGDLLYGSSSSTLGHLTIGSSGQLLTVSSGAPTWQTIAGLSGGTAGRLDFDNGTVAAWTSAGSTGQTLRWNGTTPTPSSTLANDGNGVTVNMGAVGTTGLTVKGISSQTADYLKLTDSSSNPILEMDSSGRIMTGGVTPGNGNSTATFGRSTAGSAVVTVQANGGNTSVSRFIGYNDTFIPSGNAWVGVAAGYNVSGTLYNAGFNLFAAAENHDSTHLGTDWYVALDKKGTTSATNRFRVTSEGNVLTNDNRSAISTSATDGFLYIPTGAGIPIGTPSSYTGNTPLCFDSTNGIMWGFTGSAWRSMGPAGAVKNVTTTYTMTAQDDLVKCDLSGGSSYTVTLPAANAVPTDHPYRVIFTITDGISRTLTLARAGSDTINAVTSLSKTGNSNVYSGWQLISDGSQWFATAWN